MYDMPFFMCPRSLSCNGSRVHTVIHSQFHSAMVVLSLAYQRVCTNSSRAHAVSDLSHCLLLALGAQPSSSVSPGGVDCRCFEVVALVAASSVPLRRTFLAVQPCAKQDTGPWHLWSVRALAVVFLPERHGAAVKLTCTFFWYPWCLHVIIWTSQICFVISYALLYWT
jgi:hypothetical protein